MINEESFFCTDRDRNEELQRDIACGVDVSTQKSMIDDFDGNNDDATCCIHTHFLV